MLAPSKAVLPLPTRRFPGLATGRLSARRIYLDSACLTPTPAEVCDAVRDYYAQPPGCPLRNTTGRSGELEERIREARESVRDFLKARYTEEIVFTPNTTFGINLLSGAFLSTPGKVLITDLEHNSNRLPWLAHERVEIPWPPGAPFPMEAYRRALRENVKLVSITATSNVTGQAPPVGEVVREAAEHGVPVHLDAAQAFSSGWLDITEDRPEFVTFSLHKAYGPSGLGGLYARREWLERLQPTYRGAGTVDDHFGETTRYTAGAARMEFGLQNYAAVSAVPAAMKLLSGLPPAAVREHYAVLNTALREALRGIPGVRVVGPDDPRDAHHVCSFHVGHAEALRLASLLDMAGNVQVRAGRLCAHHWFHQYEVPDVVRVSFGIHNSLREVEEYGSVLRKILRHYL